MPDFKQTSGDNRRDIRDTRDRSDGIVEAPLQVAASLSSPGQVKARSPLIASLRSLVSLWSLAQR